MATGISTNTSYPAHPYQSSSDLATTLVQNGLCGIAAYDLAKNNLVGYYRLKGYWYPFLALIRTLPARELCLSRPTPHGMLFGTVTPSISSSGTSSLMASSPSRCSLRAT